MNESKAKELLISFLEALPFNSEWAIYDYMVGNIPKGINMSDHTLQGTRLPEGFTGFFYSTHHIEIGEAWRKYPQWFGYVEDGKGIFFVSVKECKKAIVSNIIHSDDRSKCWSEIEFRKWSMNPCAWAVSSFYDITHLIVDYPSKFINWQTDPFEVKL